MDLKMEVYSKKLELLGILDDFNCVIFEEKAFSSGSFSVESLITDAAKFLLVQDHIIWFGDDIAGIIEHIQRETGDNGPFISAKGYLLTGILDRRILWGTYNLSGAVPAMMSYLMKDCMVTPTRGDIQARKIPGLVMADNPVSGESIQMQKTGGGLLDAMEELGAAYQTAFGIRFNPEPENPQMECWVRKGIDRSIHQTEHEPVFYSTELDDVLSSEYCYDSSKYKNVCLVAGEGENENRVHVTVIAEGEAAPEPPVTVGFIPLGETAVMKTSDGRNFTTRAASGDETEPYYSAYTGTEIDDAVRKVKAGSTGGVTMEQVNAAIRAAILDSWGASY